MEDQIVIPSIRNILSIIIFFFFGRSDYKNTCNAAVSDFHSATEADIPIMALTTSRITELPLRSTSRRIIFFPSSASVLPPRRHLRPRPFLPSGTTAKCSFSSHSSPWLDNWTSCPPRPRQDTALRAGVSVRGGAKAETSFAEADRKGRNGESKGQKAIERIVLRLRNLGLGIEEEDDLEVEGEDGERVSGSSEFGDEKLSDLLRKEWVRPDSYLIEREVLSDDSDDDTVLPWEREQGEGRGEGISEGGAKKDRTVKAPTLAELTIEDEELRRLRRDAMFLRERLNVAKAGLTKEVLEKIHDRWRKAELVRLKFHEVLAKDMRIAHEIVEVGHF